MSPSACLAAVGVYMVHTKECCSFIHLTEGMRLMGLKTYFLDFTETVQISMESELNEHVLLSLAGAGSVSR